MKIKAKLFYIILIILSFIIVLFFHLDTWGTATTLTESTGRILRTHRIPACTTACITGGKIDYESLTLSGENLSSDALFLSGGATEILTGLSLNLLFEQNRLSPDDPITRFYPWLTFKYKDTPTDITVRQLASHSSGIPYHTQDALYGEESEGFLRAAMREVSGSTLSFLPGTAFRVVDTDYAILAFIIEKVSGTSWADYVTKNVIEPLGLTNTYLSYGDVPPNATVIRGSRTCAGFIIDYDISLNSANTPSKGMITSMEDLTHLVRVLSGEVPAPEPLSKAVESLISQEYCAFSPEDTNSDPFYGGLFYSAEQDAFYRNAGMENFSTSLWFSRESRKAFIVQCSGMKAPSDQILENCIKSFDDKDDFLLSFISTETTDIISSFLSLIVFSMGVFNIVALQKLRKKRYSTFRCVIGVILALFYMVCTALIPFYFDCTYRMLFAHTALMVTVFIGLSQLYGILVILRIALNRKVDFRSGRGFGW